MDGTGSISVIAIFTNHAVRSVKKPGMVRFIVNQKARRRFRWLSWPSVRYQRQAVTRCSTLSRRCVYRPKSTCSAQDLHSFGQRSAFVASAIRSLPSARRIGGIGKGADQRIDDIKPKNDQASLKMRL